MSTNRLFDRQILQFLYHPVYHVKTALPESLAVDVDAIQPESVDPVAPSDPVPPEIIPDSLPHKEPAVEKANGKPEWIEGETRVVITRGGKTRSGVYLGRHGMRKMKIKVDGDTEKDYRLAPQEIVSLEA